MKRDGLTFPEALKVLAAKAGVELDERTTREDARRGPPPDRHGVGDRLLPRGPDRLEGRPARARLPPRPRLHRRDDRHVPARLRAGRLGHASPGRSPSKRQVGAEELVEAGLAQPRQSARGGVYDRFRERVIFPIRDANGSPVGLGGRILGQRRAGDGRPRPRAEVPELAGHAAVRQEPDAVPDRPGQGADPEGRPGGDRRGLHGRADGPPGRLRQRRRLARDGADARPGRAPDALRDEDRPRLRRRRRRREGRHVRRPGARGADRPAGGRRHRCRARRGPGRPPARRQGSRRGPPRDARSLARGGPDGPADRRLPDRPARPGRRPEDARRQGPLRRRDRADAPGDPEPGHARRLPPDDPPRVRVSRSGPSSRCSTAARRRPPSRAGSPRTP